MNKKIIFLFAAIFSVSGVLSALAQSQGQSASPSQSTSDVQSSPLDNQGAKRYLIGPGDLLDVRVFGQSDLNSTVEIDADGNITSLPFLEEPIPALCRNEKEVQKSIADAYAKYLVKPRISVRILERRSRPPAVVFGAVRSPMRVQMTRRLKLHELLATAGGITGNASGTIQVVHTEAELCPEPEEVIQPVVARTSAAPESDIGRLEVYGIGQVKAGSGTTDPYIRPGDIVIVTEGEPVYITGAVVAPHEIVLKDNLTLQRAIAMAGGPVRLAKTNEVHVYRQRDGKIGSEDLKFNYDAIKKGLQPDVQLQAYDIIDVRQVGTFAPKSMAEMLRGLAGGSLNSLPLRMPIP